MAKTDIKVLALDLDGTLTNDQKEITPRTKAALDAALAQGVTVVLASGRPTAGVTPVARELGLGQPGRAGMILSYNGGAIVDCAPGSRVLWQQVLPAPMVPALCAFAASQNVAIVTYNDTGVVTERPEDPWAQKEGFTNKLPMIGVEKQAGEAKFAGQIDLYPSSPFFIEAVPLGVAKDRSLAALLDRMGLAPRQLMACGDGMNDRSMIRYAGVGVAMANAAGPVKAAANYVTAADNNHDGVAEAIERFILQ